MKNKLLGSLYLSLAASIWGGMYVVVKVLVDVIPPLELVWMRYVIAFVALLIIGVLTKQSWYIAKRDFL
ncbi:EamA-like transporter family protein [compost metagenome]